jgi:hypothetical protein
MRERLRRAAKGVENLREAIRRRSELDCVVAHRKALTDLPAELCLPLLCGHVKGKLRCPPEVDIVLKHDGHPILVRQGPIWAATFHPEMSGDGRVLSAVLEGLAE